jgi:hypothetical protein
VLKDEIKEKNIFKKKKKHYLAETELEHYGWISKMG